MEVRSPTDTAQKCHELHQHKKKNGIIHKVDFSNTFLSIFVGKEPFGPSESYHKQAGLGMSGASTKLFAFGRPSKTECEKWAELLLSYEMKQCGKVKSEELALIIKN